MMLPLSCTTAPREAEPLSIERAPAPLPRPPPTIRRAALDDVISKGAGRFFARMPVEPYRMGQRLVGFRIVQLYARSTPHPEGVHVGDVVTAVNGQPISRPEQFMKVWNAVREKTTIEVDVLRQQQPVRITYRIID